MNLLLAQKLIEETLRLAPVEQRLSVAIVDAHGELLGFARQDNCALHAGLLCQRKAYTAARDRQASKKLGVWARDTGKDMAYWTDPNFTGFAGGLPVFENGKVVGAIGISGLSEQGDEDLARQVLENVQGVKQPL
jgi:glc operon protein GlcG